jgi:hypothetical protein
MSRSSRKHQSRSARLRKGGQPKLRSLSARAAWERGGAGIMGVKTNKQIRAEQKRNLDKEME